MHHRRLDFKEPAAVQVFSDLRDDTTAQDEGLARLVVEHEVEIALPQPGLNVLDAVPLLGQRPQRFAEQGKALDAHCQFTGMRREQLAGHADDVAQFDELLEQLELLLRQALVLRVDLNLAGRVFDVREQTLAHFAMAQDATGQPHIAFRRRIGPHRRDRFANLEAAAVRIDPQL